LAAADKPAGVFCPRLADRPKISGGLMPTALILAAMRSAHRRAVAGGPELRGGADHAF
jgi:hypothetical protein